MHDRLGGDIAAGARPVLDDEWLAEPLRQPLTHQARGDVESQPPGAKPTINAHRPRRIGLRPRDARHGRQRGSARCQMQKLSAGKFHRRLSVSRRFIRSPRRRGRLWRLCVRAARQAHCKSRAFARLARHCHVAAHHAGELAGDGKTEAGAAETLRGRGIGLGELLKQLGLLLRRHADASIGDGKLDPRRVHRPSCAPVA